MNGNSAIGEAAIRAGCQCYFGYPITPQNEVPAYMSARLPEVGGVFLQAESELAAINMVLGAAAAGARAMTSSSSPGISLKQEGLSYLAGAHLPCVVANIQRAGPGLANIAPAQGDYFQAVKGGGHGDYRLIVLGPEGPQEMADHAYLAFELAERWRIPVLILADGCAGQALELVRLPEPRDPAPPPGRDWVLDGCRGRQPRVVRTLWLTPEDAVEANNLRLQEKYQKIAAAETRAEETETADAAVLLAAFGTTARICKEAARDLRRRGLKAGVFRPITLWPFPAAALRRAARGARGVLTVEMNYGQMVEDVRLALEGLCPVEFYGRGGGMFPAGAEIIRRAEALAKGQRQKVE